MVRIKTKGHQLEAVWNEKGMIRHGRGFEEKKSPEYMLSYRIYHIHSVCYNPDSDADIDKYGATCPVLVTCQ